MRGDDMDLAVAADPDAELVLARLPYGDDERFGFEVLLRTDDTPIAEALDDTGPDRWRQLSEQAFTGPPVAGSSGPEVPGPSPSGDEAAHDGSHDQHHDDQAEDQLFSSGPWAPPLSEPLVFLQKLARVSLCAGSHPFPVGHSHLSHPLR